MDRESHGNRFNGARQFARIGIYHNRNQKDPSPYTIGKCFATDATYFKIKLGISPIKYVWNRRLQEASQLLATGRYTIADVSGIVGYSDVSFFAHAYREYFGFSPSAQTVSSFQTTK